ncbi:unnamed protein product [Clavelina lepadiformis]|uniref:Uncharacterized protein n=1 Tax=Clavelina lepadiformis TaxID=159417 RepID=A0ABP0GAK8_CLALP
MPALLNVLCIFFINFVLLSTMVIPTFQWKNQLELKPYVYNASNNGITMTHTHTIYIDYGFAMAFICCWICDMITAISKRTHET